MAFQGHRSLRDRPTTLQWDWDRSHQDLPCECCLLAAGSETVVGYQAYLLRSQCTFPTSNVNRRTKLILTCTHDYTTLPLCWVWAGSDSPVLFVYHILAGPTGRAPDSVWPDTHAPCSVSVPVMVSLWQLSFSNFSTLQMFFSPSKMNTICAQISNTSWENRHSQRVSDCYDCTASQTQRRDVIRAFLAIPRPNNFSIFFPV